MDKEKYKTVIFSKTANVLFPKMEQFLCNFKQLSRKKTEWFSSYFRFPDSPVRHKAIPVFGLPRALKFPSYFFGVVKVVSQIL